jgi:Tfp pilus assembly pilus retraction ATPase PilT
MDNPHLLECPDFTADIYTAERQELMTTGLTADLATTLLQNLWKKSNDAAKIRWDDKVDADRAAAEAILLANEQAEAAMLAEKQQDAVTAEKEEMKKYKSKYFPINKGRVAPKGRDVILSTAVLTKMKKGEYVPL